MATQALLLACSENKLTEVQETLRTALPSTYDINALKTDDGGCSCLHFAVIHNNSELVRVLLRYGANPAVQSIDGGNNALHFAAMGGNVGILEQLLSAPNTSKNLINSGDNDQWTPLMTAVHAGNTDIVKTLLVHGCDINAYDGIKKRTALIVCANDPQHSTDEQAAEHATEIAKILLSYGAQADKQDSTGRTCLHFAVANTNQPLISALLNYGANPNIPDMQNISALGLAERTNIEMADYIRKKYDQVKSVSNIISAHQQPLLRENERLRQELDDLRSLVTTTLQKLEEENRFLRNQVTKSTK